MFKKILILASALILTYSTSAHSTGQSKPEFSAKNLEITGFMSTGAGWQRNIGAASTELALDGTTAGVLGTIIIEPPSKNEDDLDFFVESFELDFIKNFSAKALARADLLFGRFESGFRLINDMDVEQAYAAFKLSDKYDVEILLGRFGTPMGFEPFEPYNNDTISWSILSRSHVYAPITTGVQLSLVPAEKIDLYFAVVNSLTHDSLIKNNDVPSGFMSFKYSWGREETVSSVTLSPFIGTESNSNRHITLGLDITLSAWLSDNTILGIQADLRRDDGNDGPNTNYIAALLDLRWNMTNRFYGVLKYSFMNQSNVDNGFLNLTGDKQQIHEISVGGGFSVAETIKFKMEGRFDIVDPAGGTKQWVPGVAIELASAF